MYSQIRASAWVLVPAQTEIGFRFSARLTDEEVLKVEVTLA